MLSWIVPVTSTQPDYWEYLDGNEWAKLDKIVKHMLNNRWDDHFLVFSFVGLDA